MRAANGHDWAHGRADRLGEAGAMLGVEHLGHGAAGAFGFRQRADADGAQLWQEREKNPRGGFRVAERGVPLGDGDAEPGGKIFERIAGKTGRGDFGQQPRVERARRRPWQSGARELALEHGEIEAHGMADRHGAVERRGDFRRDGGERRCAGNRGIVDAVNLADGQRNRLAGLHPPMQRRRQVEPPADEPQRAELDDPGLGRIEPGGFRIDDQGIKRDEWSRVADGRHRWFSAPGASALVA